jgi:carbohydrate kinase (thermoresistant glucokinase family)
VQGHSDTRIVYLRGDKSLIANRLKTRGDHFVPLVLLESQFATLEQPTEDERPLVIDIDASVNEIADRVVSMLGMGRSFS